MAACGHSSDFWHTGTEKNRKYSLCSFPEPSILLCLILVLQIGKGLKDTILIYDTCWNTAVSSGSCILKREGLLRQYQYNSTRAGLLRIHGCFHPACQTCLEETGPARRTAQKPSSCALSPPQNHRLRQRCCWLLCPCGCSGRDPNSIQPSSLHGTDQLGVIHQHNIRNMHCCHDLLLLLFFRSL